MLPNPSIAKLIEQAREQLDRGDYATALETFQQASAQAPQNHEVLYGLGSVCHNMESYEEAVEYLNQALAVKPNYILALAKRGLACKELKETQKAEADFKQAIALTPEDAEDWRGRGIALGKLGRYEDAVAAFGKAIEINPNDYSAWRDRGYMLNELERHEDALASYDKAIEIKPDYYIAWGSRGYALSKLGRYKKAIFAFNKTIEIKTDDYNAWHSRGYVLDKLGRYEEAIFAFNKAIEIKPDFYKAWAIRGNALGYLGRHEEAITSFDEALCLTDFQEWNIWNNRGIALLKSQGYKAAIKNWDDGIKALKPENLEYEEGCGELYRKKGKALYDYATEESEPFSNWFAAKASYEKALNFFSFDNDKFRNRYLQVLQELLQVCNALGDESASQKYIEAAAQSLEKMVAECDTQGKKITLEHRYAAFNQLRVDIKLQSKDANKEIAALELAEKRKNTCLGWLQENWDYQPPKITYQDMQKLLNPRTAAIFWHISPNAITTFIVKHNQPPIVLSPQRRSKKKSKRNIFSFNSFFGNSPQLEESKVYLQQLQNFQNWIKEWKQDYQNYCEEDYTATTKKTAPWRKKMKGLLDRLYSILGINRITELLGGIEQLILIPHRELHLLPLDYLFPHRFNIIYLPSFQIGLKLLAQPLFSTKPISTLLNITTDNLVFNTIESTALATLYPNCNQLEILPLTKKALTKALQKNNGYFHFTGDGYHVPDNPRESALVLAESEELTLAEIFDNEQLDLSKYELICLSACETGITSADSLLDEYVGLVSGFLAQGATYVLSTLWTVDERTTALLIIQFYQLMQQGNTPAIALKQAKQWLCQLTYEQLAKWYLDLSEKLDEPQSKEYLKTEAFIIENDRSKMISMEQTYAHPYYWAGFILTGKPG